ncbi:3-hydroxyacyl-CoA dehydrogenase [Psychrosphaera saromensis]|uniref:3-hydroxyacyl-CoA dehydrogenase n=1 Tax=Psychrosphaera saromensis TaxID=716813 RepID=A0A2S7UW56_9GAMM|nr:SDR family NAD(P)-dependent oxidoreductase [Psychrosphaera saromensis]PQJ53999.1 3-hydroxyacyl-CoA dehydrogenase [Psychrosphaera saromensis]GHB76004.1 3-hydroxyacyl-CoA dehydrogenase [Psychrosphaera saromensis]GLQ14515.1 3-hydroxyacyl-CoA dehydrogenase [Psychrosphaera saromensis]
MDLNNKIAVVTGGASGLGRATCSQLVAQGIKVAIFDLNEEAAKQAVAELGEENAIYQIVDVTNEASTEQAFKKVIAHYNAIHICVNCAGIAPAAKVLDREGEAMPLSKFALAININLIGTFNMARIAAHYMAKNDVMGEALERGVIINTASVAGYEGQMGQSAYAASKGGIIALSLPMARDLARSGIRVNAIAPGIMGTPMLLGMPENVQEGLVANIQFPKRMGLPKEFGDLVAHIASNAYINGETIRLDGAIRMQPR